MQRHGTPGKTSCHLASYPANRAIVLWECFLGDRYREDDPLADRAFRQVWRGVEGALVARSPGAGRILATWEDSYDRPVWRRFLDGLGYQQTGPASFMKAASP